MKPEDFEHEMAQNVLHFEKTAHVIKAFLNTVLAIIILAFIFYEATTSVASVKKDNEVTRQYVACIAKLFTYTNRANLIITDFNKCTIKRL